MKKRFAVDFNVYSTEYNKLVKPAKGEIAKKYDWDYTDALKLLNKEVKKKIDSGLLVLSYKGKKAKIDFPIRLENTGNIFEDEWNSVEIWASVETEDKYIEHRYIKANVYPANFDPVEILSI